MYCKQCGKQIADDSKFCRYCGSTQDEPSVSQESPMSSNNEVSVDNSKDVPSDTSITTTNKEGKSNRLGKIFLLSIGICILCTIGYAVIRNEDSKPYDAAHYWGSSVYDTKGSLMGEYEDQLTWMREDGYKKGIKNMAIYSFLISFGVLVVGSLISKSSNNRN